MTREEADFIGALNMCDEISNEAYKKIMCHCEEQEPCEDAISRQAVLDAFGLSEKTRKYGGDHSGYDTMMLYEIQDVIESQPSVKPQEPKWIPVSERLPENHKDVLICLSSNEICIGCYNSHKLPFSNNAIGWGASYVHNWGSNDVIAWMPLPKAYKAESEVES